MELKRGNPKFKRLLFDLYYQPVCGFAIGIIRDAKIAHEIFCDVFYSRVLIHIDDFTSLDEVSVFMYKEVYEECVEYQRRRQAANLWKAMMKKEPLDEQDEIMEGMLFQELYDITEGLPRQRRFIIRLIFFCELGTAEVARLMSIKKRTVRNQKIRGLAQLVKVFREKTPVEVIIIIVYIAVFFRF